MLLTLLYFLLALLLLVIVHEYGHFIVARWCGVKVLRFSFGFGKVLLRWHDKRGTEYAWSLFPLGGYVKMLDEAEGEVPVNERHLAFNNQALWKRFAIVFAGPLFNFIFAFIALWLVLVIGMHSLAPMVDSVQTESIAGKAGLKAHEEIISLNNSPIYSWRDFQYAMMPLVGSEEVVHFNVKSLSNGEEHQLEMPLTNWHLDDKKPDLLKSLGITPFIPMVPAVVGEVVPDTPAAKAGLKVGDFIEKVDGNAFDDWVYFVEYVRNHPNAKVNVQLKRQGKTHDLMIHIGSQEEEGKTLGFLGVRAEKVNWPAHWLRVQREGPLDAMGTAFQQTIHLTGATFTLMSRLVTGKLGIHSISGPVGIAQGAGDSGRGGIATYLFFLALVSISLGTLNLLPIPMLDGGHILYYLFELICRKPVPERVKSVGTYIGLILLVTLMCVALTNDLSRLSS